MDRLFILVLIFCTFELVLTSCGDDEDDDEDADSCESTINNIVGIIIGVIIVLAIIIGGCFGCCALLGYSCGCLKVTEAPRRVRPSNTVNPTDSPAQPPPYSQVSGNYGTMKQNGRPPSPPPSYSSLGQQYPPPTQSSVHTIGTYNMPSQSQLYNV